MLTYASLLDQAEHAAGAPLDPRLDDVVNQAGRYMCAMNPWAFLERPPVELDFVANQNYVLLPDDFDQLVSLDVPVGIQTSVILTSIARILNLRANTWTEPFNYYVALEYPAQESVDEPPPKARLAIFPTPGTTESGGLHLQYRAGWVDLVDMDDAANTPAKFDALLVQIVRAFALGYSDERRGPGSVAQRLEPIESSTMVRRLKENDSLDQQNLGRMDGGMLTDGPGVFRPFRSITLNA